MKGNLRYRGTKTKIKQEHRYFGIGDCYLLSVEFPLFDSRRLGVTHNSNPSQSCYFGRALWWAPVLTQNRTYIICQSK